MAQPAILSATKLENLPVCGAHSLCSIVDICHRNVVHGAEVCSDLSLPRAPRDRISVASYPFRAYIESPTNHEHDPNLPGMDLKDFAREVVKKFNVHNIEPHNRHFRSLDPAYLGNFREELERTSVKVVDIAVDGRTAFMIRILPLARKQSLMQRSGWT